jgi:CRP-like cAMP-binding protein
MPWSNRNSIGCCPACGTTDLASSTQTANVNGPKRRAPSNGSDSASMQRPEQNDILGALEGTERARIFSQLELVPLKLGQILCEAGQSFSHGYFPTEGIVSILYVMDNAESAEIAVVGSEGMVGVAVFMGGESTLSRSIVQNAGHAYRLEAALLKTEFSRAAKFQLLLLRYSHALITQMVQTAACNRHHSVDQQLCRWLLLSLDRLPSMELRMTLKLIGNMLGIKKRGVVTAAGALEEAGLIESAGGHITVLDRAGLEKRSCECYGVVKNEADRLMLAAAHAAGSAEVPLF